MTVAANNAIRLRETQRAIIGDNNVFENIPFVNISTIDRVMKRHQMTMKCDSYTFVIAVGKKMRVHLI